MVSVTMPAACARTGAAALSPASARVWMNSRRVGSRRGCHLTAAAGGGVGGDHLQVAVPLESRAFRLAQRLDLASQVFDARETRASPGQAVSNQQPGRRPDAGR